MNRSRIKIILGFCISFTCLFLAAWNVNWFEVLQAALAANALYLIIGTFFIIFSDLVYAYRWKYILSPIQEIPIQRSFAYTMIGFFINGVLPLRTGDLVRSGLTSRYHQIPLGMTLSVTAFIHLIDLFFLAGMAIVFSFLMPVPQDIKYGAFFLLFGIFLLVIFFLYIKKYPRILNLLYRHIFSNLSEKLDCKLHSIKNTLSDSFMLIHNPKKIVIIVLLSLLLVLLQGLATFIWLIGFHFEIPWYGGFFVLTVYNIGCALPSSPGAIGLYHYLVILALSPWIIDSSYSMSYALVSHAILILLNIIIGGYYSIKLGFQNIRTLSVGENNPKNL